MYPRTKAQVVSTLRVKEKRDEHPQDFSDQFYNTDAAFVSLLKSS